MAATGLLGINPYQRGVAIDISSKPTQMAIQLEQKEQAKNEALDKYFMDMDKNVNLAGVRSVDQNAVLQKLAENRDLFFKNKDAIRNPSKYGTDVYNKYMNNYRDALNIVNESKEAVGTLKAIQTAKTQAKAKGEVFDDNILSGISNMDYSVRDPRYVKFDTGNIVSYKPHSPYEFQKEVKTLNTIPGRPELIKEGNYQYSRTPMEADVNNVKSFAYGKLGDIGYTKMLQHLSNEELSQLDQVYQQRTGMKLPKDDIKEVSLAYTLTNLPKDYTQTNLAATPEYSSSLIAGRGSSKDIPAYSPEEHVDLIYQDADPNSPTSITLEGKTIKGKKVVLPEEIARKYDRKLGGMRKEPSYFYMSEDKKNIYPVFVVGKTKSGNDILTSPTMPDLGTKISDRIPVSTSLIPELGKLMGGVAYTRTRPVSRSSATTSTSTTTANANEYSNITNTNEGQIGIKNGKWYNIKTGKPY